MNILMLWSIKEKVLMLIPNMPLWTQSVQRLFAANLSWMRLQSSKAMTSRLKEDMKMKTSSLRREI